MKIFNRWKRRELRKLLPIIGLMFTTSSGPPDEDSRLGPRVDFCEGIDPAPADDR